MKIATYAALKKDDIKNALIAETPGGIERQEAEGQKTVVASTKIANHMKEFGTVKWEIDAWWLLIDPRFDHEEVKVYLLSLGKDYANVAD